MGRSDEFDLSEKTPVADIADAHRNMIEAELQIAQSVVRGLRAERLELFARIRALEADVRRLESANAMLRKSKP